MGLSPQGLRARKSNGARGRRGRSLECGRVRHTWGRGWPIIPAAWYGMMRDPDLAALQRDCQGD
jgi:hypothetical protein